MKTVYADIVFCLNFITDYTLLYISAYSINIKIKQIRIIAAAFIGGIYGVICNVLSIKSGLLLILNIFVVLLMSFVAYYGVTVKAFVHLIINILSYSFILCGFVSLELLRKGNTFAVIIISCILFIIVIRKNALLTARRRFEKKVSALLCKDGKEIQVSLLIDTGNLLVDYATGLPVMIVSERAIYDIEPEIIRYINFKTVNGEGRLGIAENIEVYILVKEKRIKIRAIVGISGSGKENFTNFDGILPAELAKNIF